MPLTHVERLFVIGPTGVGKTTFSSKLSQEYFGENRVVSASSWIRALYPDKDREFLTKISGELCQSNPEAGLDYLREKIETDKARIIEGVRNPYHFAGLHKPGDMVINLRHTSCGSDDYFSDFEENGIESILSILKWRGIKPIKFAISSSIVDNYTDEWVEKCRQFLAFQ